MADVMPEPRVSIVVRTKDRPHLLRRAISSIRSQTFGAWEAVVVNDGGDPAAVDAILAELGSGTADCAPSTTRSPWAVAAANAGVRATSAPLLVLHDDDDSWHPDFLDVLVGYLDEHPEEHGVVARCEVVLEEPQNGDFIERGRYVLESHNAEIRLTDLLEFNRFVPISFVYRRALHDLIGPYDDSLPAAGDWAFNLSVVAQRPLHYADDRILAYWHQRPGVDGAFGNSVHAAPGEHMFADRRHRDVTLRAYVQQHGVGLPLFLTFLEQERSRVAAEAAEAEARIRAEAHAETKAQLDELRQAVERIQYSLDRTMDTRIRGWVWRQRQRVRKRR